MRKTYDLKQVKISTSILWLLNKAETRNVFSSSMDIFSNKTKLHLHSLIIRGLISGELYCAALSKLFPSNDRPIRTKNFHSILDFLIKSDTNELTEVAVLQQKDRETFIENLTKMEPFELSEHLQIIDAIMRLYLASSEHVLLIPNILGKLCDFRPNVKDPKTLLEIWFKCMACLSLSRTSSKDTSDLIRAIIIQDNIENSDKRFLDTVKFSDKVALIMFYESEVLKIDKEFIFEISEDGSTSRDNVKNNFITVIYVFRRYFPKVLEDFKELMLVLNSSHIQISSNLLINVDMFLLEFFTCLEDISNHGNRTFRTGYSSSDGKEISSSRTFRLENSISVKEKLGVYHTVNKSPAQLNDKYSKSGVFGTYSGRKPSPMDYHNAAYEEQSTNWTVRKTGSNLLNSNRKSSVPNGLNWVGVNKTVSPNELIADGTLKSRFFTRKNSEEILDLNNKEKNDDNQTSWQQQSKNSEKFRENVNEFSNYQEYTPNLKTNETRLRLNMKRQEIEGNRKQLHQQKEKEHQQFLDKVFKDVTIGKSHLEDNEINSYRPKRVSDVKRGRDHQTRTDFTRSRSQDLSKSSVEDINMSLNQLRDEISKLSSEHAKLSAKIAENKVESTETFSPRIGQNIIPKEEGFDKSVDRSSVRSMPISWHPYNQYGPEDIYNNSTLKYAPQMCYPVDPSQKFYSPYAPFSSYPYHYGPEIPQYPIQPPIHNVNPSYSTKSLRDTDSRPTSPGAMSEPSKMREMIIVKPVDVKETEPLTIHNLMKHNKSMEQLPKALNLSDNNSKKSLIQNSIDKNYQDFSKNSVSDFSISSSIHPKTSINVKDNNSNNTMNPDVIKENVIVSSASPISTSLDQRDKSDEVSEKEIKEMEKRDKKPEISETFFVSFGNEKPNKKPLQKPKITENKDFMNNNNNSIKPVNMNQQTISHRSENKTPEKPLAFLIDMQDDKPTQSNNENNPKDKIQYLKEKREQERKEKLEKIRESKKQENELRLQKELKKEKLKEEKKRKREAIFEAHLIKKLEKENNEKLPRKENKSFRKSNRALSAAPSFQKSEFVGDPFMDYNNPMHTNMPDLLSINSKREKNPVTPVGPKLFVEPKVKSNKNVILNAIKYCCLAGKVNESIKQQTIEELERLDASHIIILMRGGCQYRSLYMFEPDSECLLKLTGIGPKKITNKMVDKFFKYNSGAKKFIEITSTNHLSTVIDGITIFNTLWKSNASANVQLNSSETSSQAENSGQ